LYKKYRDIFRSKKMGMYDTVRCLYPLPDYPPVLVGKKITFQTKSLESSLDYYTITADGRLLKRGIEREHIPEFPQDKDPGIPIETTTKTWWDECFYTGELELHTSYPSAPDEERHDIDDGLGWGDMWLEYKMFFRRGKLEFNTVVKVLDYKIERGLCLRA
jgi:hypothetical protein